MRIHLFGMHARIRSSGTYNGDSFSEKGRKRLFQSFLYRSGVRLTLKSVEVFSVVGKFYEISQNWVFGFLK